MRPKKTIFCVFPDEQELSVMKFMLETNGYRVIASHNEEEVVIAFAHYWIELVLYDPASGERLTDKLLSIKPHVPMMALDRTLKYIELLALIKVMSARKRGPRKGTLSAMRCGQNQKAVTA